MGCHSFSHYRITALPHYHITLLPGQFKICHALIMVLQLVKEAEVMDMPGFIPVVKQIVVILTFPDHLDGKWPPFIKVAV